MLERWGACYGLLSPGSAAHWSAVMRWVNLTQSNYLLTVFDNSHLCLFLTVYTLATSVPRSLRYREECGRDPVVCACVCVRVCVCTMICPKRPETGPTFCTRAWGHAGPVAYKKHEVSQTLPHHHLHTCKVPLPVLTHTHTHILFRLSTNIAEPTTISGVKQARRPAKSFSTPSQRKKKD